MKTFSITDVGMVRQVNQDYVYMTDNSLGPLPNLFVVADGMGGHQAGDYASKYTVEVLKRELENTSEQDVERALVSAIKTANREIIKKASEDPHLKGMGTTVVLATIVNQMMYFANVGDSRLYLINQGIVQLTKDHSLVEEMVRLGGIKPEEAKHHPDKNIITRAIGAKDSVEVDFYEHRLKKGDIILMCTDGLSNMVERLKSCYHISWFEESGASYPVRVFLMKDIVTVGIDTSGVSLHKRGYRQLSSKAPITETLAAALIMLTPWKKDRILVDPFCGSGTFPIEAAMMAANIAPGMNRSFTAEEWTNLIPKKEWYDAVNEANDLIQDDVEVDIQGYDIDPDVVRAARKNAEDAGVDHMIHFQQRAVQDLRHPKKYGFIITNPPYGERLEEKKELPKLYSDFGESFRTLDSWSAYMITSYEDAERYFGRKADKNRKIYNGMLKTYFYQFMGPRPPKAKK